jgi:hypothetical protein
MIVLRLFLITAMTSSGAYLWGVDPRFHPPLDSEVTDAQPRAAVLHVYLCRKLWKPA